MKQMAKGLPAAAVAAEGERIGEPNQVAESVARIQGIYRGQPCFHPELRRTVPESRADLDGVRGIGGEPSDQQADGEETANAVEQEGRAPAPADAHESLEQRIGTDVPGMASKLPVDDVYRRRAEGRRLTSAHFFMLSTTDEVTESRTRPPRNRRNGIQTTGKREASALARQRR